MTVFAVVFFVGVAGLTVVQAARNHGKGAVTVGAPMKILVDPDAGCEYLHFAGGTVPRSEGRSGQQRGCKQ